MRTKVIVLTLFALMTTSMLYCQLGIRAGINMSQEIHSFDYEDITAAFSTDNLTGYQIGLVYQFNPEKTGLGFEVGALLSQKGSIFNIVNNTELENSVVNGYKEINYIDIPINLRLNLYFGKVLSVYGNAGIYGAYVLQGKTVLESDIATLSNEITFDGIMDKMDYGYSFGGGVQLINKLQIGVNWTQGLMKRDVDKDILDLVSSNTGDLYPNLKASSKNKYFSVTLTYLF